jgi:glycosyltransferase involved in cell wall biosynthesis
LKNIFKVSSLKKKLSYSEHTINTKLFIADVPKEKIFTSIVWMGDEGNVIRKGVDKALRIFAGLKKIPEFVDYRFVIIGRKGEGEVLVRSIIDKYNLKGSVELKGEVSEEDKINLLKQSKYYFQLSLYEGFGLAALEALCANNIIIHSGKGGLANPIYKEQLLFDIDNDFDSELVKLVNKLACFTPITSYDNLLEYYDIQRRKDDFEAIIVNGKSNYKLK